MWSIGLTAKEIWLGAHLDVREWWEIYQAPEAVRERDSRIANRARAKECAVEGSESLAFYGRGASKNRVESQA